MGALQTRRALSGGRMVSAPTGAWPAARSGRMRDAPKPPLCKGRWHGRKAVTEGLAGRGGEFSRRTARLKAPTPQSASPTAPLTQGSYGHGAGFGRAKYDAPRQSLPCAKGGGTPKA